MNKEEKAKLIAVNKDTFTREISDINGAIMVNKKTSFLAGKMFKNAPIFCDDLPMPTAATNGREIFIDPEFWMKQDSKQKMRLLFHETFHMMMGHCDIRVNTTTQRKLWNIAADAVTESLANECGIGTGCLGGGVNPSRNYTLKYTINGKSLIIADCNCKSVEEIYAVLRKHVKDNPSKGPGGDTILDENGNPVESFDDHQLEEASQDEKNTREAELRDALMEHKMRGTLPGGLAGVLEKMLKGKVPWKSILRDVVTENIKTNPTYAKINRRGLATDINLPGIEKEGVDVVFAIDTSGSIGQNELMYFLGEVDNLFKQFNGSARATLLFHTVNVYQEIVVEDIKKLKGITTESGGTSHVPVMQRAEELRAKVLICLTDGYSDFPLDCKVQKMLWIVTEGGGIPQIPDKFGRKILVDKADFSGE